MELFPLFTAVLVVAAVFSWLNHRFLRLPTTVGVMAIALVLSGLLITADELGWPVRVEAAAFLERLHFREALLDVFLAFLLFAGALHVDLAHLAGQKRVIGILATVGVVVTALLVAGGVKLAAGLVGLELSFLHALLFGCLIAPTDPIAVLGILKTAGAPKELETKITGESLFNDGVGVVVFSVVLAFAVAGSGDGAPAAPGVGGVVVLLLQEVVGSVLLGLFFGWLVFHMLRSVESYQVEVLLTLALATGLYVLAGRLHSSGPLAVVVAGLLIGNSGRHLAMSEHVRQHLDTFWELVDEILNVLLFVLIGLELLVVDLSLASLLLGALAIPITLLARFVSVGGTVSALRPLRRFTPHAVKILTWGGLRGGISVALALAIPTSVPARELILTVTYVVVVFSILVQATTVGMLVRRIPSADA